MPLTFIDIERQKNWRIGAFFLILILLYVVIILALASSFCHIFSFGAMRAMVPGASSVFAVVIVSFLIAALHFYLSAFNAVRYVRSSLGASAPDPEDGVHRQLINVMEEIHVVTGGRKRIECAVLPTLSMNALSAVDIRGKAMIAITEGLLSRISRTQLEAVMAHEAYHIISGDCRETTVAASLFGIPAAAIEKISAVFEGRVFLSPAFVLAWLLVKLSRFLNLLVSREREYRADAGAVRMTRNPLALAEVLHMLSRNWRGAGSICGGLEMLCIMNPARSRLDESEGWFAGLLSTHPPAGKRIQILLDMARVDISELSRKEKAKLAAKAEDARKACFYAIDNRYQWQGPYTLAELAALPWLSPMTWISENGENMEKASRFFPLHGVFKKRISPGENAVSGYTCPSCNVPLLKTPYEKTFIYECSFCGGALVENARLPRIIARKEEIYSERIKSLSRITLQENQGKMVFRREQAGNRKPVPLLRCPKCRNFMMRTFYSYAYLVGLDRCGYCGLTWFEHEELEMLQCMVDNKMASGSAEA